MTHWQMQLYQLAAVFTLVFRKEYIETHGDRGARRRLHVTAAFTTVEVSIAVFYFKTFCGLLGGYQRFGAVCGNGGRKFPGTALCHDRKFNKIRVVISEQ
jgi:hypothetical protein